MILKKEFYEVIDEVDPDGWMEECGVTLSPKTKSTKVGSKETEESEA